MKKNIVIIMIAILIFSFVSKGQQRNIIPQLEPVTSLGSGIFSLVPPKGHKLPKNEIPVLAGPATTSHIRTKYLEVPYSTLSKTQKADIYLPNDGQGPFPVIIDIHGGAFMMGDSRTPYDIAIINAGVGHGYAVVSVNYRMSGEARFPRAVNDVKAAVRFVKANAQKYNFNADKIVAWGNSAGGNLAAMLGTTGNVKNLNGDVTENLEFSSAVQAVVDWFGPCDFTKFDEQFQASGIHTPFGSVLSDTSPESLYIGQNVKKDVMFTEKANPKTYIGSMDTKTAPYFFIEHGNIDQNIPTVQSIDLANALKAQIGANKVSFEILQGSIHADPSFFTPENFTKAFNFLDKVLKE